MKFKSELFSENTIDRRIYHSQSLREAAKEIGISAATLSRIERGATPDIETFGKIWAWMGNKSMEDFFTD